MTSSRPPSHFGYITLVCLVVASMVGTGVFTTSGFTLAALGSPWRVVLAWGIGGLLALAGAASYGRLIRAMPMSGGEYLFLSRSVHPAAGFLAGWVSLTAGFSGAAAIAALAMESYLLGDRRPSMLPEGMLAFGIIIVGAGLHGVRVRFGASVQNLIVAIKLLMLMGLCGVAVVQWKTFDWHFEPLTTAPSGWLHQITAFLGSLVWISFSYSGFNAAIYVADEVDRPSQTVSRALLHGTLIVTVLYLALNAVFVFAVPAADLAGKEAVAAIAARALGGPWLDTMVRVTIILALGTSVLSLMMAGPRVYAKMADDGLMPRQFRFGGDAPRAAIILQAIVASIFLLAWTLPDLLNYVGLTLSLSAAATVGCLFLPSVRAKYRESNGTELLSGAQWIAPILFVTGTLANGLSLGISDARQWIGTIVTVLSGALLYQLTRGRPTFRKSVKEI